MHKQQQLQRKLWRPPPSDQHPPMSSGVTAGGDLSEGDGGGGDGGGRGGDSGDRGGDKGGDGGGGDNDLDRLLDQYSAEAAADTQRVLDKSRGARGPRGMAQARQEGLATALAPDNRGFKLLKRMGYQEGQGIGAAGRTGAAEPLGLDLKTSRTGLGVDEQRKRQKLLDDETARAQAVERRRRDEDHQVLYKVSQRDRTANRRTLGQLHAAWKSFQTLHERSGHSEEALQALLAKLPTLLQQHNISTASATTTADQLEGSLNGEDEEPAAGRQERTAGQEGDDRFSHARGGRYARELLEEDQLQTEAGSRPVGGALQSHTTGALGAAGVAGTAMPTGSGGEGDVSLPEQLDALLLHLRDVHMYCLYCGCVYESVDDMAGNCPGLHEDDH